MRDTILSRLRVIEREHKVKILFAAESGSRAWGFASSDSDYDVRFIYLQRIEHYLSIEDRRDVIEIPLEGELDLCGWDFRKALALFRKSNPPLLEWLQSPIVYIPPHSAIKTMKQLKSRYFRARSCFLHYLSMAETNCKDYSSRQSIKPKKYFYVLRALLACEWIKTYAEMPPTEFDKLFRTVKLPAAVRKSVAVLLENKRASREQDEGPRDSILDRYISRKMQYFRSYADKVSAVNDPSASSLNRLFSATALKGF